MLLWIAIVLLLDAGFALLFENRVRIILPRWNVKIIALLEALLAAILVAWHFY
jgi:hypothetical protein